MAHLFKSRRRCVPSFGSLALASVRHAPAIYRNNVALTLSTSASATTWPARIQQRSSTIGNSASGTRHALARCASESPRSPLSHTSSRTFS